MTSAKLVVPCQNALGENPLWHERDAALYWTDIEAGKIYRFFPDTGKHELLHTGPKIGGFTFHHDGSLLLFEVNRIARLSPDGVRAVLRENITDDMQRFNDVIADPAGRVYAGTIGQDDQRGGLYRVDLDGTIVKMRDGTGISNGMGFSPNLKRFYWTCSTQKQIFAYDYDHMTGALTNEQLLYSASQDDGTPDGMAVDARGHIWTAHWGGSAVLELSPEGELLNRHRLEVPKVTSVAFGGANLDLLFVTTAGGEAGSSKPDGGLYQLEPGAQGRKEFVSKARI